MSFRRVTWLYAILINMGDKQKHEEKPGVPLLSVVISANQTSWNGRNSWLLPTWFRLCLTCTLGFRKEFSSEWPKIKKPKSKCKQTFNQLANQKDEKDKSPNPASSESRKSQLWHSLWFYLIQSVYLQSSYCHLLLFCALARDKGGRGEDKAELRRRLCL